MQRLIMNRTLLINVTPLASNSCVVSRYWNSLSRLLLCFLSKMYWHTYLEWRVHMFQNACRQWLRRNSIYIHFHSYVYILVYSALLWLSNRCQSELVLRFETWLPNQNWVLSMFMIQIEVKHYCTSTLVCLCVSPLVSYFTKEDLYWKWKRYMWGKHIENVLSTLTQQKWTLWYGLITNYRLDEGSIDKER